MKFKIGDDVRVISNSGTHLFPVGTIGTIISLESGYYEVFGETFSQCIYELELEALNLVPDTKADTGLNKDDGKLRVDLVPISTITAIAEVLGQACRPDKNGNPPKYPERNWEKGIGYSRIYANVQRHLLSWWSGKDIDSESGLHTLKHAICRLSMLVEFIEKGRQDLDDRPEKKV